MRTALVCLGICLISASARAQAPVFPRAAPQAGSKNIPVPAGLESRIRRPVSPGEQLLYERAAFKARERDFRMESRKWSGFHPQRPAVRHGHYSNDLNRYIWSPVAGYYYLPGEFGRY